MIDYLPAKQIMSRLRSPPIKTTPPCQPYHRHVFAIKPSKENPRSITASSFSTNLLSYHRSIIINHNSYSHFSSTIMKLVLALTLFVGTLADHSFLRYLDPETDPCDDFYRFACGNFAQYHPRPEHQDLVDLFTLTEDELVKVGHEILSSPKKRKDHQALKKVKSTYKACIDLEEADYFEVPEFRVVEEFGGMPLLGTNQGPLDWRKIAHLISTTGVHQIFNVIVRNFDPEAYLLIFYPDSAEEIQMIRPRYTKSYDDVLTESLKRTHQVQARSKPDNIDLFFLDIAKHLVSHSQMYYKTESQILQEVQDAKNFLIQLVNGGIVDDQYIPLDIDVTIEKLQEWSNKQFGTDLQIDWLEYLGEMFKWAGITITKGTQLFNILGPEKLYGPLNLIRKTDPNTVKNALLLRSFAYLTPDSDASMRRSFDTFVASLQIQVYPRWEYCTRKILDVVDPVGLSFAVTHEYQRYHYDATKIRKVVGMTNQLREAFRRNLHTSDWIDDESLGHLVKKVDNMAVLLAYPDFVQSKRLVDGFYENVRICEWDAYGNARNIRAFRQAYALTRYTEMGGFWGYPPLATNAYTIQPNNQILIPISVMQEGFFTGNDPIVDYGRLGVTMAHEITHNFDSMGITFNEDAFQNKEFLTNQTKAEVTSRIQCLVDQYNQYFVPEVNATVNGKQTKDENIADNGGIRQAFFAFQNVTRNTRSRSKDYTLDQMFFISFATMWCSEESKSWLEDLVEHNVHAPSSIRVLGTLSNFEEFSKAFDCPVGSRMNPKDKCVLW